MSDASKHLYELTSKTCDEIRHVQKRWYSAQGFPRVYSSTCRESLSMSRSSVYIYMMLVMARARALLRTSARCKISRDVHSIHGILVVRWIKSMHVPGLIPWFNLRPRIVISCNAARYKVRNVDLQDELRRATVQSTHMRRFPKTSSRQRVHTPICKNIHVTNTS
jgi:hypothetical protein